MDERFKLVRGTACLIQKVDAPEHLFRSEARDRIESNWKKLQEKRPDLYNSQLLRVTAIREESGVAVIEATPDVCYKDVVGLRYLDGRDAARIDARDSFAVLSSYLIVHTSDNRIVLVERDCGDWGKALDMCGGFIPAQYPVKDVSVFAAQRVKSDLSVHDDHIGSIACVGIFRYDEILETMAICQVQLALSFDELKAHASVALHALPAGYQVQRHSESFDLRLHTPAVAVLSAYLEHMRLTLSDSDVMQRVA